MSILFHNKGQIVQLSNDTISYVMEIVDGKYSGSIGIFRTKDPKLPGDRKSPVF